jgi:hypothetical protein
MDRLHLESAGPGFEVVQGNHESEDGRPIAALD